MIVKILLAVLLLLSCGEWNEAQARRATSYVCPDGLHPAVGCSASCGPDGWEEYCRPGMGAGCEGSPIIEEGPFAGMCGPKILKPEVPPEEQSPDPQ